MIDLQALVGRLGRLLNDEGLDFWTPLYLAESVNEACKAIIRLKPEAHYVREVFEAVAGKVQQVLPDAAVKLIDIEGTVTAGGDFLCPVTSSSVAEMNRNDRGWQCADESSHIEFFMYEDLKPRDFWVSPKPAVGTFLSLVYSTFPAAVGVGDAELDMSAQYEGDVINYCLWRAWIREGTEGKTLSARQVFHEELGIVSRADDETHPQDNRRRDERRRAN